MIKEKEVPVPATTRKVKVYVCDVCDREGTDSSYGKFRTCIICGRLHCGYWTLKDIAQCGYLDDDGSDYPDPYCKYCWRLKFDVYAPEYKNAEQRYDEAIEDLDATIKEKSLDEKPIKPSTA